MKEFADRVAVITGAAEGIGRAFAEKAAGLRMRLVLSDINGENLEKTAAEIREKYKVEVVTQVTDVAQEAAVNALADRAYREFGHVHLLFNNAGVALGKPSWETTTKEWEWVLGVNLWGVIHGIRAFVPRMMAGDEEGHIINTSSAAGLLSQPGFASYNVSKHGVVTLTEGLYHDLTLRQSKVSASVLCPAWVKTRIADIDRYNTEANPIDMASIDRIAAKTAKSVQNAVAHGSSPEGIADITFDAIENNRFYILPHENIKIAVSVRMTDIIEGKQPHLLPFN